MKSWSTGRGKSKSAHRGRRSHSAVRTGDGSSAVGAAPLCGEDDADADKRQSDETQAGDVATRKRRRRCGKRFTKHMDDDGDRDRRAVGRAGRPFGGQGARALSRALLASTRLLKRPEPT